MLCPSPPTPPPPPKQVTMATSLDQIVLSKQAIAMKQQITLAPEVPHSSTSKVTEQPIIRRPRRTNPAVWCGAIFCLIFSLLLIFFGIATLIVVLVIKPRNPVFDTPAASLNVIYFDSPENFNGDFTFVANFSNPSRKFDVRFEYGEVELYFSNSLIATQAFQPFTQRHGEARLVSVHMISSLVYLPLNLALELQKQLEMTSPPTGVLLARRCRTKR